MTLALLVLGIVLFALGFTAALRWLLGPERLAKAAHSAVWFPLPQLERLGERLIRPGSERAGTDQIVGSVATVVGTFRASAPGTGCSGRVRLAGAEWLARSSGTSSEQLLIGTSVIVREEDGLTLVVEPLPATKELAG